MNYELQLSEIWKHLYIEMPAICRHRAAGKYPAFDILEIESFIPPRYKPLSICRAPAFTANYSPDHTGDKPPDIQSCNVRSLQCCKLFHAHNNVIDIRLESFSNRDGQRSAINDYFKKHTYLQQVIYNLVHRVIMNTKTFICSIRLRLIISQHIIILIIIAKNSNTKQKEAWDLPRPLFNLIRRLPTFP